MCDRVMLPEDLSVLKTALNIQWDNLGDYAPRWNVAPASRVPVISNRTGARSLEQMRWGLIPSWATDERNLYSTFNAAADVVATKPAFRDAWKAGRRCLIVAGGFYQWRNTDKQPFCIALGDKQPMLLAGLWEEPNAKLRETMRSCTIITTAANEVLANIHERMPVIVDPADYAAWLGEDVRVDPATLLKPFLADRLTSWPVDKRLADVANQGREFAEPMKPAMRA